MATPWKTVRVFISSTFRDMHAERDYLVHDVFLELKERCAKRRLHLIDVDLRWGVTEEEDRQGKVLEICLDEIERCRPFFIGLLGERYGWAPPKYDVPDDERYHWVKELEKKQSGHSVTALETYHGVLRNPSMQTRAFFYFRDPSFLQDPRFLGEVPTERQNDFLRESEDAARKLKALKDEIKAHCSVFENYPCEYGGLDEKGQVKLTMLDAFGKRLLEEVWEAIKLEHPEDSTPPDELTIERSYHEAFIENRSQRFIGRREVLAELTTFTDAETEGVLVAIGKAGCGKSAVLANFVRDHAAKHPDEFVLAHFIGVSPGSTDIRRTLLRLCRELARQFNIQDEIPTDYYELRQTFVKLLEQSVTQGKVLLVIDALNQLDEGHYAQALDWLPRSLPAGLRIIVSTIDDSDCLEALRRRDPAPREAVVGALAEEERREIVRQTLKAYRKHLDERPENDQMRTLLSKSESDNPLYLTIACEELRVFGEFERVTKRIEALPGGVESLFEQVLERIEDDHERVEPNKGRERVRDALSLLECSRHGLLESEMLELLARDGEAHLPRATWARLYRGLKFYLRPSGSDEGAGESGEGVLDFFHRQLAKAVRQRYLKDEDAEVATHRRLAKYFRDTADPSDNQSWSGNYPRALSELPHHLLVGKLYSELFAVSRDETLFRAQAAAFPDDPELQLQTLHKAITGAAEIDDAEKMAEFVLAHARRLIDITQQSPLDVLRDGHLERAWKLADLHEIEVSIQWHLLLAWELKDAGHVDQAIDTIKRLKRKTLPNHLTLGTFGFPFEEFFKLADEVAKRLLERLLSLDVLCEILSNQGEFEQARQAARGIADPEKQSKALVMLASAQVEAGDTGGAEESLQEALSTTTHIYDAYRREEALEEIAIARARMKSFQMAEEIAKKIDIKGERAVFLLKLALIQLGTGAVVGQESYYSSALELVDQIEESESRTWVLGRLASLLAQAGERVKARDLFQAAMRLIRLAEHPDSVGAELSNLASRQTDAGEIAGAKEAIQMAHRLAKSIDDPEMQVHELYKVAIAESHAGDIEAALLTASQIESHAYDDWEISEVWAEIATAQARAGAFDAALQLVSRISEQFWLNLAMDRISTAQAEAGNFQAALRTAEGIIDDADSVTLRIADLLVRAGKPGEARRVIQRTLQTAPNTNAEMAARATTLCEMGKAERDSRVAIKNLFSALESAEQIDDIPKRVTALRDIAAARREVGEGDQDGDSLQEALSSSLEPALYSTNLIVDQEERATLLSAIAVAQALGGNLSDSRETFAVASMATQSLDCPGRTANVALQEIANSQVEAGDVLAAFQTVQRISERDRPSALSRIAIAQARMKDFDSALLTACDISDQTFRDEAVTYIACAKAKAGDLVGAMELAESLDFWRQIWLFPKIAVCQACAGNTADAVKNIERTMHISDDLTLGVTIETLCDVATTRSVIQQVDVADMLFRRAQEQVKAIDDPVQQAAEFVNLSRACLIAGFDELALSIAQDILTDRNERLPEIADTLTEKKDKENFKRLLGPCAQYLDSGYRVCGMLARLYPEQANDIAQILER